MAENEDQDKSQKTEEPTEKRLREAEEKGNLPRAREVGTFMMMATAWLIVIATLPGAAHSLTAVMLPLLENPNDMRLNGGAHDVLQGLSGLIGTPFALFQGMQTEIISHEPTLETLKELEAAAEGPCLSLFCTMEVRGDGQINNASRLKNRLQDAEKKLKAAEVDSGTVEALLAPARDLLPDDEFWLHQREGLAVFICKNGLHALKLPHPVRDESVLDECFHFKQLVPALTQAQTFHLLALAKGEVKLYKGDRQGLQAIDLKDLPHDIDEALWYDYYEESLQQRTGNADEAGAKDIASPQPGTIYHSHGEPKDSQKDRMRRFFLKLDRALHDYLNTERTPLVLACVEYYLPFYREVNTYPHLLDAVIPGNVQHLQPHDLHKRALQAVEMMNKKQRVEAELRLRELQGTARASALLDDVVTAAAQGRVDECFVVTEREVFGKYSAETGRVTTEEQWMPGTTDLVNLAVQRTLLQGGTVHPIDQALLPEKQPVAAIFRYTV